MHWESILTKLKAGSYQPSPVKRIYIIPPSSETRRPSNHEYEELYLLEQRIWLHPSVSRRPAR